MGFFFTDSDLTGAGEFVEAEVTLGPEFTIPAGSIARFRARWPAIAPAVTPKIRVYNTSNALVAGPYDFDSTTLSDWNNATPGAPVSLDAGTYYVTWNTTRYPAVAGFFAGGPITRNGVTAVQGRFASGVTSPTNTSTALYPVDIDFTAGAGSIAPTSITGAVTIGSPTVAQPGAAPDSISLHAEFGDVTLTQNIGGAPSWEGLQAVVDYARAVHAQQERRDADPVECPQHRWPLTPIPGKRAWHCQFGGHVVMRGRG